jgi:glucokinase
MGTSQTAWLGIDIGGTHTKVGMVDTVGALLAFERMPTDAGGSDPQPFLRRLEALIARVRGSLADQVSGVGVSMHGMLNTAGTGASICHNTPALRGFDLRAHLQQRYGVPVMLHNDLTAHALAEYHFGVGQGARRFLCLALGTGLGAGVIIEGEPLRFLGGRAGDTGRLILDPQGSPDVYGARGSAEDVCGVAGIERLARSVYGFDVPAHQVISAARLGDDRLAEQVMTQVGRSVGHLLASLCMIFLPEKVALTGGTTEAGAVLLAAVRAEFERLVGEYHRTLAAAMPAEYAGVEIVIGASKGETGVIGAVAGFLKL